MKVHLPVSIALACLCGASITHAQPAVAPLAHWTFDEVTGAVCRDAGEGRHDARPSFGAGSLHRIDGLFGPAMAFAGEHRLVVEGDLSFTDVPALTLSAWVLPTDLTGYREILRKEDGEQRVLFSFQGDGTILSLGLNVGGYAECDATVDPALLRDGRWHHCAATFDGSDYRVFLDGQEVGSLHRPGGIASAGPAPVCIGSSNGGECFQGVMDDVRVYASALAAAGVRALYEEGVRAQADGSAAVNGDRAPALEAPLLASWSFDARGLAADFAADGDDRSLDIRSDVTLATRRGIHGRAIDLSREHALPVALGPRLAGAEQLSVSAWVRPRDLSGFREILRQESAHRVLFSFQESGNVLSLGLDVGGYAECDATVDPARLVDGTWHHCAATFDWLAQRVYLDGEQVGILERPGRLAVDTEALAFVGSSGGESEQFDGVLDDLRVYGAALTAEQVHSLWQAGHDAEQRFTERMDSRLSALCKGEADFATALGGAAERYAGSDLQLDFDVVDALEAKFRTAFPDECRKLVEWTGLTPAGVVADRDGAGLRQATERLRDLLLEYEPLTPEQWAQQTPEDLARWREARKLGDRVTQLTGAGGLSSAQWLELALEMGPRIQFRPAIYEPVAPYRTPTTPVTRDLTADEASEVLRRDWLYQADGNPSPERIRQEIEWTRALARRIERKGVSLIAEQRELDALAERAGGATAPDEALYLEVRGLKRRIAFRNPAIDFTQVLFTDSPYPDGSEWRHETRHRLGYMAVPGGRLLTLDGLSPAGRLRQLMPQAPLHGSFWRPDLSYDGKRVLFCFKPHNEKSYHLYEIGIDGSGLTQLTSGPYDDLDPIYLPDGEHIAFSTTRGHTYVRCMPPTNAFVLARAGRDGRGIYLISCNNEPDYLASVMDDGRILYTRWEYTDKPLWRAQGLWTVNPDGTQGTVYWGNQSVWPDLLKDARVVPGTRRVMFTGSAHHDWFAGSVGMVDTSKGLNFPWGVTKVTAEVAWPESGNGPSDPIECADYHTSGRFGAYYSPYPLSEEDFLVSAERGGRFALYLMDVHGNRELIHEGDYNIFDAIPVRPRTVPPALPDRVAWPTREARDTPQDGTFLSANVYEGTDPALRGKARFLRVLSIDPKTYTYWYKRPYISTGPVVSIVQSEGVKRVLGTVPVADDGSVAFQAPAGMALHFQLLDENQRALQTMRSFAWVMPGERRGCVGCHEQHSVSPATPSVPTRLGREAVAITPPAWEDRTVSYHRYVQPVLDQYCGRCHQGEGEARETLDLTARSGFLMFDEPYVTLTGQPAWGAPNTRPDPAPPGWGAAGMLAVEGYSTVDPKAYRTPAPMTALSYRSTLIEHAASGKHHGVKVDPVSLERLTVWVDAMCPYIGEDEIRAMPDPEFPGVDWLAVRPRLETAPRIARPGPLDD